MTFTFQFYNKTTGEQRATGNIYASSFREAVAVFFFFFSPLVLDPLIL